MSDEKEPTTEELRAELEAEGIDVNLLLAEAWALLVTLKLKELGIS
jgi:hypothetical protein